MKRLAISALTTGVLLTSTALAEDKFVTIGTGGQTGVYYAVGQSICKLVNRSNDENKIKCTAPSTGGSVANLNAIKAGEMDMGVAQSDWQFHAYNGTSKFKDQGANGDLRAVFSVHPEPFTVIARTDANVKSLADLKGKKVNIGNPGSGQEGTWNVVWSALGFSNDDLALASQLKSSEQSSALCDNKVDAIIFTAGHPNGSIKEATTSCDAQLINVTGPEIEALYNDNAYYAPATIPGGMYKGTDEDVTTFGVGATFVSSTNTDADTIYAIVKAVFENFDRFKKLHPAFGNLKEADMIVNNLSAPLHEGAKRYYKERGWL